MSEDIQRFYVEAQTFFDVVKKKKIFQGRIEEDAIITDEFSLIAHKLDRRFQGVMIVNPKLSTTYEIVDDDSYDRERFVKIRAYTNKRVQAKISFNGGTNNPTLDDNKGVASIAYASGTGLWDVTLDDSFDDIRSFSDKYLGDSLYRTTLVSITAASKVFRLKTYDATPAAFNPASGQKLYIELDLKYSDEIKTDFYVF